MARPDILTWMPTTPTRPICSRDFLFVSTSMPSNSVKLLRDLFFFFARTNGCAKAVEKRLFCWKIRGLWIIYFGVLMNCDFWESLKNYWAGFFCAKTFLAGLLCEKCQKVVWCFWEKKWKTEKFHQKALRLFWGKELKTEEFPEKTLRLCWEKSKKLKNVLKKHCGRIGKKMKNRKK